MKFFLRYSLTIVLIFLVNITLAQESSEYHKNILNQLYNWQVSESEIYKVDSLTFEKEAGHFTLKNGNIFLLPKINNRYLAAVFFGNGIFQMTPPTKIEQDHLYRFVESKTFRDEFERLLIVFADTSFIDILKDLHGNTISKNEIKNAGKHLYNMTRHYLGDIDRDYFHSEILKVILNDHYNDFFYTHMSEGMFVNYTIRQTDEGVVFKISPYNDEEVTLKKDGDIMCMFHRSAEYESSKMPRFSDKDELKMIHQKLNCSIEDNMDFIAVAQCEIKLLETVKWFKLRLFSKAEIDSLKWADGSTAEYFKGDENNHVWIKVPQHFNFDDKAVVSIYYRSDDLLMQYDEWVSIRSYHNWRPLYGGRDQYTTYDIQFKTPDHYDFACVGEKQKYEEDGDYIYSHWVVNKPARNIAFNIGRFKIHEMEHPKVNSTISVLISESGHRGPEIAFEFGKGKNMEKQVGTDVLNSMLLYQELLGPIEMSHFYVTEYPRFWSGEAFPGLINLGWKTFQSTDSYGHDEILRAHEVAHQWWGIAVDFESYHDQWLSEGLSEFFGLWYLHIVSEDKSRYMDMIEKSKERIFKNRKFLFGDGQEAGPIWLGYRTNSSETPGDYGLIVYQKSAWVLQMLRTMMLNLNTMNEDPFTKMISDVFQSYKGKKINTEAFIKIVEKHFGMPMDWFFNQWIYNTDIPTYKYSYSKEKQPDGKYNVLMKVKQENVSEDFQMYVPIKIDFGNDRFARLRIHVNKPSAVIKLPVLPLEPEEIIFNDLNGVLAEVEEVDWEDI